jgi:hypothetical protein
MNNGRNGRKTVAMYLYHNIDLFIDTVPEVGIEPPDFFRAELPGLNAISACDNAAK